MLTRPAARFTTDARPPMRAVRAVRPRTAVFQATEPSAIDVVTTLRVEAMARPVLAPCPVIP
jgi:hypothetical protein